MKYLCLIYNDESFWTTQTPEEKKKLNSEYGAFTQNVKTSGHYLGVRRCSRRHRHRRSACETERSPPPTVRLRRPRSNSEVSTSSRPPTSTTRFRWRRGFPGARTGSKPETALPGEVMASLQAALKTAIQIEFQLEEGELAAEALPSSDDRRYLLLYEAAEGGAGV